MNKIAINPKSVFNSLQYGFSQAIAVQGGQRVSISGQVGVDADENLKGTDLFSQAEAAFDNIELILAEIGGQLPDIVMMRIYILESERANQAAITKVLLSRFRENSPATSWIFVGGLSLPEWLIEIEAEAVLPSRA